MQKSIHIKNIRYLRADSVQSVFYYVLSLLTILVPACMWFREGWLYNITAAFYLGVFILVMFILGAKMSGTSDIRIERAFFYDLFFAVICICMSFVTNPGSVYYTVTRVLDVMAAWLFLAYLLNAEELIRLYETFINIMCLIAAVSLPLWIFGGILNVISPTATITYIWDGERLAKEFFWIYYIPRIQMMDIFSINIPKNCAIFTEGTMYGYLLVVAYLLHRNCLKRSGFKRIILMVAIVSTLSVSPILALLMDEAIYFVFQKNKNKKLEAVRIIAIPLFLIGFAAAFVFVMQQKSETGSYGVRLDHLLGCVKIFNASFPFGVGFGERDSLYSYFKYAQGLSVGLPYLLAQGGVGALALLIVKFSDILRCSIKMKDVGGFAFAGVFLWIAVLTNNILHPVFWMVLMLVFTSYRKVLRYRLSTEKV